jgi:hypothetical protein
MWQTDMGGTSGSVITADRRICLPVETMPDTTLRISATPAYTATHLHLQPLLPHLAPS